MYCSLYAGTPKVTAQMLVMPHAAAPMMLQIIAFSSAKAPKH
jgi:hypothetical protein